VTRFRDPWLRERLEELAADLCNLRRREESDWRLDRACGRLWWLLAATRPTAGDLYRETGDVDVALAAADDETHRLKRLLGEPT
jgi:hypothetical protein